MDWSQNISSGSFLMGGINSGVSIWLCVYISYILLGFNLVGVFSVPFGGGGGNFSIPPCLGKRTTGGKSLPLPWEGNRQRIDGNKQS